jgi:citrate lyase beta subunit
MPALTITENRDRVRLALGGLAHGEGSSLQEAADDLVCSILRLVMAFRASGFKACSEVPPDFEAMNFLYELGEIAAAGGDIRSRVFV